MSNCKHLKLKLDRTLECKLTGKKISWNECKNCKLREYKLIGLKSVRTSPTQSDSTQFKSIQIHSKNNSSQLFPTFGNFIATSSQPKKKEKKKPTISAGTRAIVHERDNHICQLCGRYGNHLHHIITRQNDTTLIDDPNNLITLCFDCHINKVTNHEKDYEEKFKELLHKKRE